jgi:inositol transport system substrate-binding protein
MAGTLQMTELARLKGGTGKVAILQGMPGDYNTVRRTQGCTDVIAQNPGMEVVLEGTANYFRDQALAVVENWLQSGTEFDVICSNNDEMALGAILALQAAGKTLGADGVVVGGVDATRDALGAVQDGSLAVTVFQDGPGQGAAAVDAVKKLIAGETLTDNYFDVPFQLVTPENLGDFLK